MGRTAAHEWRKQPETLAGLEPKPQRGWLSLRWKFASDLVDKPLKVLCELGGWKGCPGRCSSATRGRTRDDP